MLEVTRRLEDGQCLGSEHSLIGEELLCSVGLARSTH